MNAFSRWLSICVLFFAPLLSSAIVAAQASATTEAISWSEPQPTDGIPVSSTLEVMPPHPTVDDPITVVVGGVWSDGCIPYDLSTNIADGRIVLTLITPPPDVPCGQALAPWSLRAELGTLPQGIYLIQIQGGVTLSTTVGVNMHLIYLPTVSSERSITE